METNIQSFFKQILQKLHILKGKLNKRHYKRYVREYIHAVKPPYTKHDLPHILGTFVVILIILSTLSLMNTFTYRHTFASNQNISPSKPQILVGIEKPFHIPYTHAEQGSVHIYWLPSSSPQGISGYKIYRNNTKIGDTTNTFFDDNGVSGDITYTIEAYDKFGNSAKSNLHLVLPSNWTQSSTPSDSVISGFVINKKDNNPIGNTIITISPNQIINTTQNGYYYLIYKGQQDQIVQVTLNAKGYRADTEQIQLKKGQSGAQNFYLTKVE